jgi:hypothetical protein
MKEIAAANTNVPGTEPPMPDIRNLGKSQCTYADASPKKGGRQ